MSRRKTALTFALLALALPGCPGTTEYCQSGPKHGTQCYHVDPQEPSDDPAEPPPDHQQQQLMPH